VSEDDAWLQAGGVGAPHGLDGSFHVTRPSADLLRASDRVLIRGTERLIERRAGTDRRPIIRLQGCADRAAAEALRGERLLVPRGADRELGPDEWWAADLEGCVVHDGDVEVGTVRRLLALPSCEVLEVDRGGAVPELLVPLVGDAVRSVDVAGKRIEIDLAFLGED